ncbi:MAG: ACP phosphodiesterase [Planctomycetota bacterium]|nr:ACP phosphodiesterase [Planctomycetota bacterium]
MNYLAHLRLSPAHAMLRLGNLCGDFRRGMPLDALPAVLQRGAAQHLALDEFTDRHVIHRRSRARLAERFARWSGVLVDVFYDHFLASDWPRWGDGRPLPTFTGECYQLLEEHRALLPPQLQDAAPRMAAQDWLGAYASLEGIDRVLGRMSQRIRRANPVDQGGQQLRQHYDDLRTDFAEFFADALEFAASWGDSADG